MTNLELLDPDAKTYTYRHQSIRQLLLGMSHLLPRPPPRPSPLPRRHPPDAARRPKSDAVKAPYISSHPSHEPHGWVEGKENAPVRALRMMTACMPIFFRSSCSGSEAQLRKVATSLAIWVVVAGVPCVQDPGVYVSLVDRGQVPVGKRGREGGGTHVGVLDKAVVKNTGHTDGSSREVGVWKEVE